MYKIFGNRIAEIIVEGEYKKKKDNYVEEQGDTRKIEDEKDCSED